MVPARPALSHLTTSLQSPPSESACTRNQSTKDSWKREEKYLQSEVLVGETVLAQLLRTQKEQFIVR